MPKVTVEVDLDQAQVEVLTTPTAEPEPVPAEAPAEDRAPLPALAMPGVTPVEEFEVQLDGAEPTGRAVLMVERIRTFGVYGDMVWLEMSRWVYQLATEVVATADGAMKLWQLYSPDPDWRFGQFARDILQISDSDASQYWHIWETYRVRLEWSLDQMLAAGRGKLVRALGYIRRLLMEGARDYELENMLHGNGEPPASLVEIGNYVMSKRTERVVKENGDVPMMRLEYTPLSNQSGPEQHTEVTVWCDDIPRRIATIKWDATDKDWPFDMDRDAVISRMLGRLQHEFPAVGW